MLPTPPWVPVAAPVDPPPPDQPITVWIDTGSGAGLEVRVDPANRWRIWPVGAGRHCLLIGAATPEDVDAAAILTEVSAIWRGPFDPYEQDVP
nr:hypothetical protein [Micromonospora sp. DSM 115978]